VKRPALTLAAVAVAQFMVSLDLSVVNVGLPRIAGGLGFSAVGVTWVINAYALTFGGLLLVGGKAADRYGRKRVLLLGLCLFGLASLAGGFAQEPGHLVAARAVQGIGAAAAALAAELRAVNVRVRFDDRPEHRSGFKFNEWELKGVPLRIELGARDLAAGAVTTVRRDSGDKQQIPMARAALAVDEMLARLQAALFQDARDEQQRRTLRHPSRYDEMIEHLSEAAGFVVASWCGRAECEERVKEHSSATIRCLPLDDQPAESRPCICCGRSAQITAVWAQAY